MSFWTAISCSTALEISDADSGTPLDMSFSGGMSLAPTSDDEVLLFFLPGRHMCASPSTATAPCRPAAQMKQAECDTALLHCCNDYKRCCDCTRIRHVWFLCTQRDMHTPCVGQVDISTRNALSVKSSELTWTCRDDRTWACELTGKECRLRLLPSTSGAETYRHTAQLA